MSKLGNYFKRQAARPLRDLAFDFFVVGGAIACGYFGFIQQVMNMFGKKKDAIYEAAAEWAEQLNVEFKTRVTTKQCVDAFDIFRGQMNERYIDCFFKNRAGGWRTCLDIEDREALIKIIEERC